MSLRIRYMLWSLSFFVALLVIVGLVAGTFNLPWFWLVSIVQCVVGCVGIFRIEEDLLEERRKPAGKDEDPNSPRILSILFFAHYFIAALDVGRWHLSDNVPMLLHIVGVLGVAIGWSGLMWAMAANRYFSSAIRLQSDRGQTVVMGGPYRYVRHPGYVTAAIAFIGQALAFGSWISMVPMLLIIFILVKRTIQEEQLLSQNLPGYSDYKSMVRYKWWPGVW